MNFDLRWPVGLMFSIFGLITSGVGIFGPQTLVAKSLGININLWWGILMLAFGLFMLFMAWRKHGS